MAFKVETFRIENTMPEVDLANVKLLVDRLIHYNGVGEMSFDDIAHLQALLPAACGSMAGIEHKLTYVSSSDNYALASEALTSGMKVTLVTVITAAIAMLLKFFKIRRDATKAGFNRGSNRKEAEKGTPKYLAAVKQDLEKTYPVFETQIEEFQYHIDEFRKDGTLQTLDGDVYPELVSLVGSMYNHVKTFSNMPVPEFQRNRDKNRMGEFLNVYAEALGLGKLEYKWIAPYNYFFMTDAELYKHTRFLDQLFIYLKRNRSFETTIPDLCDSLARLRFSPDREADVEAPGAKEGIDEMYRIIENGWAPKEMAEACGLQVRGRSNFDAFLVILESLQEHTRALFGTELYEEGPGDDKFKKERMQAYFDFLVKDTKNPMAETANAISIMADECGNLLRIAESYMTPAGTRTNFLAEAKAYAERIKFAHQRDQTWTRKPPEKFNEQEVKNLADLKEVGVFITAMVRFTAELTRIVEFNTRMDEKLDDLETKMTNFTKLLLQVNQQLKKVKT